MDTILYYSLLIAILVLACMLFLCLIRAAKGPSIADRLVSINMIGTIVIMIMVILTVLMKEAWLADIAAIYAMISFIGIVVFTKIYIGVYREKHAALCKEDKDNA